MAEFRRTLQTSDSALARKRALKATTWFHQMMQRLVDVPSLTRADLEQAATTFFAELVREIDRPRNLHPVHTDEDVQLNIEASRQRAEELLDQLKSNQFDRSVQKAAQRMVGRVGAQFENLTDDQRLIATQLAARAEKVQMDMLVHLLTDPGARFETTDQLFGSAPDSSRPNGSDFRVRAEPLSTPAETLGEIIERFLRYKSDRGIGQSHHDEMLRSLGWLKARLGPERPLASITKRELAAFRDDLVRLDATLQGRELHFEDRLTNIVSNQIKSVTAKRYWRSVQLLFKWPAAEGFLADDTSNGLIIEPRKGEKKRSPEPFSKAELYRLCQTPLYSGYKSRKRFIEQGPCHNRAGHWWSGVLLMFTGLRAGELSQLLQTDFEFDADIPQVRVREEDDTGRKTKRTKTQSSVRDIPLHPILLQLGLREFVAQRKKTHPGQRLLIEFRLGARERVSDGMTKFWGRYLKEFALWKEGRSTHVWRHTFIASLRENGATDEEIAPLVGHSVSTQTAAYGGAYPMNRKLETLRKLDYGFDVLTALGGPYDPAHHGSVAS